MFRIQLNPGETEVHPEFFAYDLAGDMLSNSRLGTYAYPAATAPRPHAQLTAGARVYGYDANGNALSDGTRAFTGAATASSPASPAS